VTDKPRAALLKGEVVPLGKRKLTEETCAKWRYEVGHSNGKPCQIANYCDTTGRVVAQKIRYPDKDFRWTGDVANAGLYGQHLWRDGGKMVVITEGEIDALSVSQLQENKWPVVSLPNGAGGAKRDLGKQIEWLEKYESIILMFDNDPPGIAAAEECAAIFSPGKAKIAQLPLKDANDMLVAGRGREVIAAMWDAKTWRPDEIIAGAELWETIIAPDPYLQTPYPWTGLNDALLGIRQKEIVTLCAGSGIGKSTVCREFTHWLVAEQKQTVGYIALEESVKRSALGILAVEMNKPLHLMKQEDIDQKKLRKAYERTVGSGRFYTYDHFGSLEAENLFSRIKYLVTGCGCGWIVLDHLSIIVSGMGEGDERRLIDNLMTKLRSLVEQLGFGLILVSHLKDTEGKSLEEGGKTHLNLLRGSRAIGQLSDVVLGFERDQQSPEAKNKTVVRILKNRMVGITGVYAHLNYDSKTGRLTETSEANAFAEEPADQADDKTTKKDF
jgi:twinkle protein